MKESSTGDANMAKVFSLSTTKSDSKVITKMISRKVWEPSITNKAKLLIKVNSEMDCPMEKGGFLVLMVKKSNNSLSKDFVASWSIPMKSPNETHLILIYFINKYSLKLEDVKPKQNQK